MRHITEIIVPNEYTLEEKGDIAEIIVPNDYPLEEKGDIQLKVF